MFRSFSNWLKNGRVLRGSGKGGLPVKIMELRVRGAGWVLRFEDVKILESLGLMSEFGCGVYLRGFGHTSTRTLFLNIWVRTTRNKSVLEPTHLRFEEKIGGCDQCID